MNTANLNSILNQLQDHEKRISALENGQPNMKTESPGSDIKNKQLTMAELIKGRKFNSGQEKVAIIVGYCEKILKLSKIKEGDIRNNWVKGKFDGKYRSNVVERASRDGLIRDLENGTYDLSQTGEHFFEEFLNKNAGQNQKGTK